jgi:DNA-binding response OmpR family regulator
MLLEEQRVTDAKRILVVDDEPEIRESLAMAFEMKGYQVLMAQNGTAGLELARDEKPDLIILDVTMPEMSGFKVSRFLKFDTAYKRIPIIMLTGRSSAQDQDLGLRTGVDLYLTKPFDLADLMGRAEQILSGTKAAPPVFEQPWDEREAPTHRAARQAPAVLAAPRRRVPWRLAFLALCFAACLVGLWVDLVSHAPMNRLVEAQDLGSVSPHLAKGRYSSGPGPQVFVGHLFVEPWGKMGASLRRSVAEEIQGSLARRAVTTALIYGKHGVSVQIDAGQLLYVEGVALHEPTKPVAEERLE